MYRWVKRVTSDGTKREQERKENEEAGIQDKTEQRIQQFIVHTVAYGRNNGHAWQGCFAF